MIFGFITRKDFNNMTVQFEALTKAVTDIAATVALVPPALDALASQKEDSVAVQELAVKVSEANDALVAALAKVAPVQ